MERQSLLSLFSEIRPTTREPFWRRSLKIGSQQSVQTRVWYGDVAIANGGTSNREITIREKISQEIKILSRNNQMLRIGVAPNKYKDLESSFIGRRNSVTRLELRSISGARNAKGMILLG